MKRLTSFFYSFLLTLSSLLQAERHEKILVTSIPKCGTNLVIKYVTALTEKPYYTNSDNFLKLNTFGHNGSGKNNFCVTHATASKENIEVLEQKGFRGIFIYRDPRDQVVSFAHYIKSLPDQWPTLSQLPIDQLILELILDIGIIKNEKLWAMPELIHLTSINTFYNRYLDWLHHPLIYSTTYEKLVGKRGGGSDGEQLEELIAIARHFNFKITFEEVQKIAENLYGGTGTFRFGKIGSWKSNFNEEHKKAFKQVAGQLLITLKYEQNFNW